MIATFGHGGMFPATSAGIRYALGQGHRLLVWHDSIYWTESINLDDFGGGFLSCFGYGGPLTMNAVRKCDGPCLYSERDALWRLHLRGVSFDDGIGGVNKTEAPFLRFPRVDRSRITDCAFHNSQGPAFVLGASDGTGHVSETYISGVEVFYCGGAQLLGMRNCTIDGRGSFERNTKPVQIIGDPLASGDSTIRDINLEGDDGKPQLEIHRLTNSTVEDIRIVEAALVGRDCKGTSPRKVNCYGAASVDWPGASFWDRRTWRKVPRNARSA